MIKKLLFSFTLLWLLTCGSLRAQQNDFEISKNLDVFVTLYKQLNNYYVDDLNPGQMIKTAIDAMLETLDPYTVYITESEIEDYRFMTTGQYGGIGAVIFRRGGRIYISEPYQGFPADKAGLQAGDEIVEINGKPAAGKTVDEVSTALKGQPGTTVTLLIRRDSTEKPVEKQITREEIKVDNVPYSGLVSGGIGYINLSEFKQNAGNDVKDAFIKLNEEQKLKGIILDLRGNGGGLLNEAVNIVNIFVDKGQLVVSTRGKLKDKNNIHKTLGPAVDTKIPLVILVDENSASASEIVTGAIQDLDRGVIIGQRTFGKGLVQNIVPLSYNAELKVTIAKYYIPSGRCVQALDYTHKNSSGVAEKIPDSLRKAFKTRNGRIVYEGMGIDPDIIMPVLTYSDIASTLTYNYLIFDYATRYFRTHDRIDAPDRFEVTGEIFNDFLAFLKDKDYHYVTESEETLAEFRKNAEEENYFVNVREEFDKLSAKVQESKSQDIFKFRDQIRELLKLHIVPRYYYNRGRIQAALTSDPEVKKAIDILNDPEQYDNILRGPGPSASSQKSGKKK